MFSKSLLDVLAGVAQWIAHWPANQKFVEWMKKWLNGIFLSVKDPMRHSGLSAASFLAKREKRESPDQVSKLVAALSCTREGLQLPSLVQASTGRN